MKLSLYSLNVIVEIKCHKLYLCVLPVKRECNRDDFLTHSSPADLPCPICSTSLLSPPSPTAFWPLIQRNNLSSSRVKSQVTSFLSILKVLWRNVLLDVNNRSERWFVDLNVARKDSDQHEPSSNFERNSAQQAHSNWLKQGRKLIWKR